MTCHLLFLSSGQNRRDGPLNGDLETLAAEHRKKYAVHDQSQDVVQGYWSKSGSSSKGGLFAALDALETPAPPPPPAQQEEEVFTLDDFNSSSSLFADLDKAGL